MRHNYIGHNCVGHNHIGHNCVGVECMAHNTDDDIGGKDRCKLAVLCSYAYMVMAYTVMAYIVMAYMVMAYMAMAYIVMAEYPSSTAAAYNAPIGRGVWRGRDGLGFVARRWPDV